MSEENTNDVVPAVLAEGEAVIPAEKVEEFKAIVEEIAAEAVAEEAPATKVEEVAAELNLEPKISVVEETEDKNIISSGSQNKGNGSDLAAGLTAVENGVIGTGTVKRKPAVKQVAKPVTDRVAIHSTKNVSWPGVGKVFKGINIVGKDQADKWLTRDHITLVKPEDVAKEFGL